MSILRDLIRQEIKAAIQEEIRGAVRAELTDQPEPAARASMLPDQPIRRRRPVPFQHRWPKGTIVRVNGTFFGTPAAPGTHLYKVWSTIRDHLKPAQEIDRGVLTREIEILLDTHGLSSAVTQLLKRGCLSAVVRT
jgi:hypothetical protein